MGKGDQRRKVDPLLSSNSFCFHNNLGVLNTIVNAGGGFRTRDLQIMSIALVGEPLEFTKLTGTLTRLSYPGMYMHEKFGKLNDSKMFQNFTLDYSTICFHSLPKGISFVMQMCTIFPILHLPHQSMP